MKKISEALLAGRKKKAAAIITLLTTLYPKIEVSLNHRNPWELLVAVVLSAQCTDKKVNEVTAALFKKYRTLDDYVHAKQSAFEKDIKSTGFYRAKAKNILSAAKLVRSEFHGKVPRTMEELVTIPGVGRKTANVILEAAFGIVEGIAIDTHVRRLANLWGLSKNQDPEKIERDLMEIIPRDVWRNLSLRIIMYGREYCPAKSHTHIECPVSQLRV